MGDNGAHPHSLVMHHVVIIIVEGAADVGCCLWGGMLMSPVRAYVRIGEGIIQAIWGFWGHWVSKTFKKKYLALKRMETYLSASKTGKPVSKQTR